MPVRAIIDATDGINDHSRKINAIIGFEILYISEQIETLNFEHPKQILQHLKATGVTATASNFRWTKQSLQDFYLNYQQFSFQNEIGKALYPLSYHPIYCIARRMP